MAQPIDQGRSAGAADRARTPRPGLGRALREAVSPLSLILALLLIVGTPLLGWNLIQGGAFRSSLELYGRLLTTPLILVFPLLSVAFGCSRVLAEVANRHVVNVRVRAPYGRHIATQVAAAGILAFVPFFLLAVIPYVAVVGFGFQPPAVVVAPEIYELTAAEAEHEAGGYATMTQLYAVSPILYGILYPLWVGLGGALCAALGALALFVVPNRFAALLTPFAIVFGESLVVSLLGQPSFAVIFNVFPFGLTQSALFVPGAILVFLLAVVALLSSLAVGSRTVRERFT